MGKSAANDLPGTGFVTYRLHFCFLGSQAQDTGGKKAFFGQSLNFLTVPI